MEKSSDGGDDHNSGWLEVRKRHRNSSKFSLQSYDGEISGKNSSKCQSIQNSLGKHAGRENCRSHPSKSGKSNAVHFKDVAGNSLSLPNEDKKCIHYLDKRVIRQDESTKPSLGSVTNSLGQSGDCDKNFKSDELEIVHKIKWGHLDDADLLLNDNGLEAGIKFGDIEGANVVCSRKQEDSPDMGLFGDIEGANVVCSRKQEDSPDMGLSINSNLALSLDSVPSQTILTTERYDLCDDNSREVNEISSECVELQVKSKVNVDPDHNSNSEEINTEDDKHVNDACFVTNSPLIEEAVKFQVLTEVDDSEISNAMEKKGISRSSLTVHDTELVPAKRVEFEASSKSIAYSVEEVQIPEAGAKHDDAPNTNLGSALGEDETAESKERFRQRLWCFLFENLNRAVDELYLLCELECDVEQMKEAVLVLEEAAFDFRELNGRVEEFEKVKKSSLLAVADGVLPITLKGDHRRPHALSWEVRRMTTSSHRAEILSSSLEAFKKIREERAIDHISNDTNIQGPESLNLQPFTETNSSVVTHDAPSAKDSVTKSCLESRDLNITLGVQSGEGRKIESTRFRKMNLAQNGRPSPPFSVNSSKSPVAGKCKKEQLDLDVEKLLPRREKVRTENNSDKFQKSTDQFKKVTVFPEKDKEKERRNTAPWKSMDAWKEKRNWEDILSSSSRGTARVSHSPGMNRKSAERARVLHDKLMSPEKKKKTAVDLKREAEEKHARAMKIRSDLENERVQKLQRTSEKLNRVNEWQAVRTMKLREGMFARQQRSESRHEAFLAQVVKRAGDESSKVNEVRFITSLNEENKKIILRQKLHGSELRRAEKLQVMKTKQKEDMAREEAVLERRKLIEAEKLQRLAETQRKKEEAHVRREEERKASSAAREARALEQIRRKEERAKAQQEEAELLAQKLAERLSESEQRRKFYLEQIRERASMDFRDQSSPLMRRSVNKDSQGRSPPANSGEDRQPSNSDFVGTSPVVDNAVLQNSVKRRIKRIRQRLMALKYEFIEPSFGAENVGIGYRTAVGTARVKVGRWLQELQRLRQARKEGAANIGLIIADMIKFLDGKDPELQASRQAGLLDFIASALPASHTSKPEACQVTIHLLRLLRVVLSVSANMSYFLAQNLLPPIIPMLSVALENYIKIAASINAPGNFNILSSKTSIENFESISEVVDGFLWTVSTIMGHVSFEERQIQMWDGLLELLITYQVIHRLRDLFALYDRPQVEGSPFPSSILLSINLLVVLTSRPGMSRSINWELLPIETIQKVELADLSDSKVSHVTEPNGECKLPSPLISYAGGAYISDVVADSLVSEDTLANSKMEQAVSSGELNNLNAVQNDIWTEVEKGKEIQKPLIPQRYEDGAVNYVTEQKVDMNLEQPVVILLSSMSDTGLVSLTSLLTAVLLQANNRLSSELGSYVLPSNFEEVAVCVLKVLNHLALLDLKFMQRMLARSDLRMEFFHLMSFLLSHCTSKWKDAKDQIGLLLLESLLLLAHFALFHPGNQAVLRWGKSPTILHKVCDLPFVFFSDSELMPVLGSTLVAICYGCEQNKSVVQQELSTDMLLYLLRSCRNVIPAHRLNSTIDSLPADNLSECNQQGPEFRKHQMDSPIRSNRCVGRTTKVCLGKPGYLGNSIRIGRARNVKDNKITKPTEEMAFKHNQPVSDFAKVMLHYRFTCSFIDRAEQFFSAGIPIEVNE